jgi:hypothetical protein
LAPRAFFEVSCFPDSARNGKTRVVNPGEPRQEMKTPSPGAITRKE